MREYTEAERRAKRKYYLKNRERIIAASKARWYSLPAVQRRAEAAARARAHRLRHPAKTKEQRRESGKKLHYEYRFKLIEEMGGKCLRCGYSDKRILQLDHVHGDGALVRYGNRTFTKGVYEETRRQWKAGNLQLLCPNCNWLKRVEMQEWRPYEARAVIH